MQKYPYEDHSKLSGYLSNHIQMIVKVINPVNKKIEKTSTIQFFIPTKFGSIQKNN
jgi:hypothetical protein